MPASRLLMVRGLVLLFIMAVAILTGSSIAPAPSQASNPEIEINSFLEGVFRGWSVKHGVDFALDAFVDAYADLAGKRFGLPTNSGTILNQTWAYGDDYILSFTAVPLPGSEHDEVIVSLTIEPDMFTADNVRWLALRWDPDRSMPTVFPIVGSVPPDGNHRVYRLWLTEESIGLAIRGFSGVTARAGHFTILEAHPEAYRVVWSTPSNKVAVRPACYPLELVVTTYELWNEVEFPIHDLDGLSMVTYIDYIRTLETVYVWAESKHTISSVATSEVPTRFAAVNRFLKSLSEGRIEDALAHVDPLSNLYARVKTDPQGLKSEWWLLFSASATLVPVESGSYLEIPKTVYTDDSVVIASIHPGAVQGMSIDKNKVLASAVFQFNAEGSNLISGVYYHEGNRSGADGRQW